MLNHDTRSHNSPKPSSDHSQTTRILGSDFEAVRNGLYGSIFRDLNNNQNIACLNSTFVSNEHTYSEIYEKRQIVTSNQLTFSNCLFQNCVTAVFGGGGLFMDTTGKVELEFCDFLSCSVSDPGSNGGGFFRNQFDANPSDTTTIIGCVFTSCSGSLYGGGVRLGVDCQRKPELPATLKDCLFLGNRAEYSGGGLHIDYPGESTITNCSFIRNTGSTVSNLFIFGTNQKQSYSSIVIEGSDDSQTNSLVSTLCIYELLSFSDFRVSGGSQLGAGVLRLQDLTYLPSNFPLGEVNSTLYPLPHLSNWVVERKETDTDVPTIVIHKVYDDRFALATFSPSELLDSHNTCYSSGSQPTVISGSSKQSDWLTGNEMRVNSAETDSTFCWIPNSKCKSLSGLLFRTGNTFEGSIVLENGTFSEHDINVGARTLVISGESKDGVALTDSRSTTALLIVTTGDLSLSKMELVASGSSPLLCSTGLITLSDLLFSCPIKSTSSMIIGTSGRISGSSMDISSLSFSSAHLFELSGTNLTLSDIQFTSISTEDSGSILHSTLSGRIFMDGITFSGCSCGALAVGRSVVIERDSFENEDIVLRNIDVKTPNLQGTHEVYLLGKNLQQFIQNEEWEALIGSDSSQTAARMELFGGKDPDKPIQSGPLAYLRYPYESGRKYVDPSFWDHEECGLKYLPCKTLVDTHKTLSEPNQELFIRSTLTLASPLKSLTTGSTILSSSTSPQVLELLSTAQFTVEQETSLSLKHLAILLPQQVSSSLFSVSGGTLSFVEGINFKQASNTGTHQTSLFSLSSGFLDIKNTNLDFDSELAITSSLIAQSGGSLTLTGCSFSNVRNLEGNGGVLMSSLKKSTDSLSITSTTFRHCSAGGSGGVLFMSCASGVLSSQLVVAVTSFDTCSSGSGKGGCVFVSGSGLASLIAPSNWSGHPTSLGETESLFWGEDVTLSATPFSSATLLVYLVSFSHRDIFLASDGQDVIGCGRSDLPCATLEHSLTHLSSQPTNIVTIEGSVSLDFELKTTLLSLELSGKGETKQNVKVEDGGMITASGNSLVLKNLHFSTELTSSTSLISLSSSESLSIKTCSFVGFKSTCAGSIVSGTVGDGQSFAIDGTSSFTSCSGGDGGCVNVGVVGSGSIRLGGSFSKCSSSGKGGALYLDLTGSTESTQISFDSLSFSTVDRNSALEGSNMFVTSSSLSDLVTSEPFKALAPPAQTTPFDATEKNSFVGFESEKVKGSLLYFWHPHTATSGSVHVHSSGADHANCGLSPLPCSSLSHSMDAMKEAKSVTLDSSMVVSAPFESTASEWTLTQSSASHILSLTKDGQLKISTDSGSKLSLLSLHIIAKEVTTDRTSPLIEVGSGSITFSTCSIGDSGRMIPLTLCSVEGGSVSFEGGTTIVGPSTSHHLLRVVSGELSINSSLTITHSLSPRSVSLIHMTGGTTTIENSLASIVSSPTPLTVAGTASLVLSSVIDTFSIDLPTIVNQNGGSVTIISSSFSDGSLTNSFIASCGSMKIVDTRFTELRANSSSNGNQMRALTLTVNENECVVIGDENQAVEFVDCSSDGDGGAMFCSVNGGGELRMLNVSFSGCSSSGVGGGLAVAASENVLGSSLTIRATFSSCSCGSGAKGDWIHLMGWSFEDLIVLSNWEVSQSSLSSPTDDSLLFGVDMTEEPSSSYKNITLLIVTIEDSVHLDFELETTRTSLELTGKGDIKPNVKVEDGGMITASGNSLALNKLHFSTELTSSPSLISLSSEASLTITSCSFSSFTCSSNGSIVSGSVGMTQTLKLSGVTFEDCSSLVGTHSVHLDLFACTSTTPLLFKSLTFSHSTVTPSPDVLIVGKDLGGIVTRSLWEGTFESSPATQLWSEDTKHNITCSLLLYLTDIKSEIQVGGSQHADIDDCGHFGVGCTSLGKGIARMNSSVSTTTLTIASDLTFDKLISFVSEKEAILTRSAGVVFRRGQNGRFSLTAGKLVPQSIAFTTLETEFSESLFTITSSGSLSIKTCSFVGFKSTCAGSIVSGTVGDGQSFAIDGTSSFTSCSGGDGGCVNVGVVGSGSIRLGGSFSKCSSSGKGGALYLDLTGSTESTQISFDSLSFSTVDRNSALEGSNMFVTSSSLSDLVTSEPFKALAPPAQTTPFDATEKNSFVGFESEKVKGSLLYFWHPHTATSGSVHVHSSGADHANCGLSPLPCSSLSHSMDAMKEAKSVTLDSSMVVSAPFESTASEWTLTQSSASHILSLTKDGQLKISTDSGSKLSLLSLHIIAKEVTTDRTSPLIEVGSGSITFSTCSIGDSGRMIPLTLCSVEGGSVSFEGGTTIVGPSTSHHLLRVVSGELSINSSLTITHSLSPRSVSLIHMTGGTTTIENSLASIVSSPTPLTVAGTASLVLSSVIDTFSIDLPTIVNQNGGSVTIISSSFSDGSLTNSFIASCGSMKIVDTRFTELRANSSSNGNQMRALTLTVNENECVVIGDENQAVEFVDCSSDGDGGAMFCSVNGGGELRMLNVSFSGCSSSGVGGGLAVAASENVLGSSLTIRATFSSCSCGSGAKGDWIHLMGWSFEDLIVLSNWEVSQSSLSSPTDDSLLFGVDMTEEPSSSYKNITLLIVTIEDSVHLDFELETTRTSLELTGKGDIKPNVKVEDGGMITASGNSLALNKLHFSTELTSSPSLISLSSEASLTITSCSFSSFTCSSNGSIVSGSVGMTQTLKLSGVTFEDCSSLVGTHSVHLDLFACTSTTPLLFKSLTFSHSTVTPSPDVLIVGKDLGGIVTRSLWEGTFESSPATQLWSEDTKHNITCSLLLYLTDIKSEIQVGGSQHADIDDCGHFGVGCTSLGKGIARMNSSVSTTTLTIASDLTFDKLISFVSEKEAILTRSAGVVFRRGQNGRFSLTAGKLVPQSIAFTTLETEFSESLFTITSSGSLSIKTCSFVGFKSTCAGSIVSGTVGDGQSFAIDGTSSFTSCSGGDGGCVNVRVGGSGSFELGGVFSKCSSSGKGGALYLDLTGSTESTQISFDSLSFSTVDRNSALEGSNMFVTSSSLSDLVTSEPFKALAPPAQTTPFDATEKNSFVGFESEKVKGSLLYFWHPHTATSGSVHVHSSGADHANCGLSPLPCSSLSHSMDAMKEAKSVTLDSSMVVSAPFESTASEWTLTQSSASHILSLTKDGQLKISTDSGSKLSLLSLHIIAKEVTTDRTSPLIEVGSGSITFSTCSIGDSGRMIPLTLCSVEGGSVSFEGGTTIVGPSTSHHLLRVVSGELSINSSLTITHSLSPRSVSLIHMTGGTTTIENSLASIVSSPTPLTVAGTASLVLSSVIDTFSIDLPTIVNQNGGSVTIISSSFSDGSLTNSFIASCGSMKIVDTRFTELRANSSSNGNQMRALTLTVNENECVVIGDENQAVEFVDCSSDGDGGAMFCSVNGGGELRMLNVSFSGCSSSGVGGGLAVAASENVLGSSLTIRATFSSCSCGSGAKGDWIHLMGWSFEDLIVLSNWEVSQSSLSSPTDDSLLFGVDMTEEPSSSYKNITLLYYLIDYRAETIFVGSGGRDKIGIVTIEDSVHLDFELETTRTSLELTGKGDIKPNVKVEDGGMITASGNSLALNKLHFSTELTSSPSLISLSSEASLTITSCSFSSFTCSSNGSIVSGSVGMTQTLKLSGVTFEDCSSLVGTHSVHLDLFACTSTTPLLFKSLTFSHSTVTPSPDVLIVGKDLGGIVTRSLWEGTFESSPATQLWSEDTKHNITCSLLLYLTDIKSEIQVGGSQHADIDDCGHFGVGCTSLGKGIARMNSSVSTTTLTIASDLTFDKLISFVSEKEAILTRSAGVVFRRGQNGRFSLTAGKLVPQSIAFTTLETEFSESLFTITSSGSLSIKTCSFVGFKSTCAGSIVSGTVGDGQSFAIDGTSSFTSCSGGDGGCVNVRVGGSGSFELGGVFSKCSSSGKGGALYLDLTGSTESTQISFDSLSFSTVDRNSALEGSNMFLSGRTDSTALSFLSLAFSVEDRNSAVEGSNIYVRDSDLPTLSASNPFLSLKPSTQTFFTKDQKNEFFGFSSTELKGSLLFFWFPHTIDSGPIHLHTFGEDQNNCGLEFLPCFSISQSLKSLKSNKTVVLDSDYTLNSPFEPIMFSWTLTQLPSFTFFMTEDGVILIESTDNHALTLLSLAICSEKLVAERTSPLVRVKSGRLSIDSCSFCDADTTIRSTLFVIEGGSVEIKGESSVIEPSPETPTFLTTSGSLTVLSLSITQSSTLRSTPLFLLSGGTTHFTDSLSSVVSSPAPFSVSGEATLTISSIAQVFSKTVSTIVDQNGGTVLINDCTFEEGLFSDSLLKGHGSLKIVGSTFKNINDQTTSNGNTGRAITIRVHLGEVVQIGDSSNVVEFIGCSSDEDGGALHCTVEAGGEFRLFNASFVQCSSKGVGGGFALLAAPDVSGGSLTVHATFSECTCGESNNGDWMYLSGYSFEKLIVVGNWAVIDSTISSPSQNSLLFGTDLAEQETSQYRMITLLYYLIGFEAPTIYVGEDGRDATGCGQRLWRCRTVDEGMTHLSGEETVKLVVSSEAFLTHSTPLGVNDVEIRSESGISKIMVETEGHLNNAQSTVQHTTTFSSLLFSLLEPSDRPLITSNRGLLNISSCKFEWTGDIPRQLISLSAGELHVNVLELTKASFSQTPFELSSFSTASFSNISLLNCTCQSLLNATNGTTLKIRDSMFDGVLPDSDTNSETICSWDTGLIQVTNCELVRIDTCQFCELSQGGLLVEGSHVTLHNCLFEHNSATNKQFPSVNRNIRCTGNGSINIPSVETSGMSEDVSNWIRSDDCSVTLAGTKLTSPFFIAQMSEKSTSTLNKKGDTLNIIIYGQTLIPCGLSLVVFEWDTKNKNQTKQRVTLDLITLNPEKWEENTLQFELHPQKDLSNLNKEMEWRGRLQFGAGVESTSWIKLRDCEASIRKAHATETVPWIVGAAVGGLLILLALIVILVLVRRCKKHNDEKEELKPMMGATEEGLLMEKVEMEDAWDGEDMKTTANMVKVNQDEFDRVFELNETKQHLNEKMVATAMQKPIEVMNCDNPGVKTFTMSHNTLYNRIHTSGEQLTDGEKHRIAQSIIRGLIQLRKMDSQNIGLKKLSPHWILFGPDKEVLLKTNDDVPDIGETGDGTGGGTGDGKNIEKGVEGLRWMAPDVYIKKDTTLNDHGTVFSLGLVLWEIETGSVPFGETDAANAQRQLGIGVQPPMDQIANPKLGEIIGKCLSLEPKARPNLKTVDEALSENLFTTSQRMEDFHQ
ncbi:hypothetical protein BLNAU_16048 [Blattamonas nauphoetae]|uniref:Protein kinase domain-containing protein n=1 Tax=Blattamonas nauphoetae TaxID=2049346 RepID=A0ABQ9X9A3_9EUKA|nr:hypothetical protein BLNAU_16048 [Blattamonas nauphoetae]